MTINMKFAALLLAAGSMLAACGTSDTAEDTSNGETTEETAPAENSPTDAAENPEDELGPAEDAESTEPAESEPAETGEADSSSADEPADTEPAEPAETESDSSEEPAAEAGEAVSYTIGGESKSSELAWTESDEQSYRIGLLPDFELTSEEPNKDALYWTEDESVFMRIETFSTADIDFTFAENAMKESLQAVNPETEPAASSAFDSSGYQNASAQEITSADGKVTGIVYEKDGLIVRLTVFDKTSAEATDAFITMGKTIEAAQ